MLQEITWQKAILIARRREEYNNIVGPLSVVCNGAKGDFMSLKSTGVIGVLAYDGERWFVDTGSAHVYLSSNATVWVG